MNPLHAKVVKGEAGLLLGIVLGPVVPPVRVRAGKRRPRQRPVCGGGLVSVTGEVACV